MSKKHQTSISTETMSVFHDKIDTQQCAHDNIDKVSDEIDRGWWTEKVEYYFCETCGKSFDGKDDDLG